MWPRWQGSRSGGVKLSNNDRLIDKIDIRVARKLSINQAKEYGIIPIYEDEKNVYIAATETPNNEIIDILSFLFNKKIKLIYREKDEILELIQNMLNFKMEDIEAVIFEEAIACNASDIHYEPEENGLNIRFRINGSLTLVRKLSLEDYQKISSRLKIKADMDITEKRRPQDGKLFMWCKDKKYNCRLSTVPVIYGEKIVLRILYSDRFLTPIEDLQFTREQQETLSRIIRLKNGLVLVNGPTGSGKSTTLYTILNEIKDDDINISTLEDPVEVTMKGINQVNLNYKIGLTFVEGLRSLLRQDPNVIMVGEIRDEETAKMAVRSAITGHKVYSTIHTKSPREVYLRLEEMGVKGYLIKDALVGIISQRLIKLLCKCKEEIGVIDLNGESIEIYKKCGCNICNNSGYIGRQLIASVYHIDKKLKGELSKIYEKEDLLSNCQMVSSLRDLLLKGVIDYYDYLSILEGEELNED